MSCGSRSHGNTCQCMRLVRPVAELSCCCFRSTCSSRYVVVQATSAAVAQQEADDHHSVRLVQGAIVQIMGVPSRMWSEHLPSLKWQYPPAAFVHMSRDTRTGAVVADNVATLSKAGIPTVEIRVDPAAMTPATFAEAIEEVRDVAIELFACDIYGCAADSHKQLCMCRLICRCQGEYTRHSRTVAC